MEEQNNARIYIVDDDSLSAKVMSALLSDSGHTVVSTTDAASAFDKILDAKPDCVICEMMMPVVDGLNLCKRTPSSNSPRIQSRKHIPRRDGRSHNRSI